MDFALEHRRLRRASSSASARRRSAASCSASASRNYVESSIGSPKERTEITVRPEGRVDVVIGTQPSGQGHETSFAQVVADLIAVPVETVNIIIGDTDIVSVGGGSHSGRSMRHAATVISKACRELIAKGKRIAALVLDTHARTRSSSTTAGSRRRPATAASISSSSRRRPRGSRCRDDLKDGLAVVDRQRDARSGVSRTAARSARSRSIPTPARVDDHALCRGRRRRPLHQSADRPRPDAWRHRAGRRPGDVGAVLRRSRSPASR